MVLAAAVAMLQAHPGATFSHEAIAEDRNRRRPTSPSRQDAVAPVRAVLRVRAGVDCGDRKPDSGVRRRQGAFARSLAHLVSSLPAAQGQQLIAACVPNWFTRCGAGLAEAGEPRSDGINHEPAACAPVGAGPREARRTRPGGSDHRW